jgi:hypothetical protein
MGTEIAFGGARPAAAFANLNPTDESLSDGIGTGYGIVGYKGKVWSLRHRGERHVFTRADDGSPLSFLDVVILRQLPVKSKSYYPQGSFNDDAGGVRPVCASLNGLTPDEDVTEKQASACAICPRNVVKVNAEGRKGRECRDYKRLAVLIVPKLTKQLLGAPLLEPVFLRVPAASLAALGELGDRMGQQGWHYSTFVTRIGFVAEAAHPQMTFKEHVVLTEAEGALVMPMRDELLAKRITGEADLERPAVRAIATEPVQAAEVIEPEKPKPAPKAAPKKEIVIDNDDSGFGDTTPAPKAAAKAVVVDEDVDEANDDLDARVAAILKTQ